MQSTCKSHAFPKTETYFVPAERSAFTPSSSSAGISFLAVEPKATSFALRKFALAAISKKRISFGFEKGLPASIKETPKLSRLSAILSLSSAEKLIPSPCAPSLRVESRISSLINLPLFQGNNTTPDSFLSSKTGLTNSIKYAMIAKKHIINALTGRSTQKPSHQRTCGWCEQAARLAEYIPERSAESFFAIRRHG